MCNQYLHDCGCDRAPAPPPSDAVSILCIQLSSCSHVNASNFHRRSSIYPQALDAIQDFTEIIPASQDCIACAVAGCDVCCCSLQKLQNFSVVCWCKKCTGLLCAVCEKTVPEECLCLHPDLEEGYVSLEEVIFKLNLLLEGSILTKIEDTRALLPRAREVIFVLEDRLDELEEAVDHLDDVRFFSASPR